MYYDLLVHTNETIGENSLEELIETAKSLSINSLGIQTDKIDRIKEMDIVSVALVKAKNINEMHEEVKRLRNNKEVIIVYGGDYDINRAACENRMVDILIHPELGRKDSGLDHICVKEAAKNNVAIGISFHDVLESYKKQRIIKLAEIRKNVLLCKKYNAKIVIVSSALSKWDLRNCRDMASIVHILGLTLEDSIRSVSKIPEKIIKENRLCLAGKKWDGIKVV